MNGLKSCQIAVLSLLGWCLTSPAQAVAGFADEYADAIQQLLDDQFDGSNAGIVIGLVDEQGSRVFSTGGLDNGTDKKIDADTLFEIGSVTKVFTALLLLDAVRRGEMKLEDPVGTYLPDGVKMPNRGGKEITLLNLAAQDSGLPFQPDNLTDKPIEELSLREMKAASDAYTVEKMYAFLSNYRPMNNPGREFEYSNVGMSLLGHAIERKAGASYESLVIDRICRPLKMDDTRITLSDDQKSRLATGHLEDGSPSEHWNLQAMASAGSLISTTNDLLKFLSANLGFTENELTPLMKDSQVVRHTGSRMFGKTAIPWVDEGIYNPPGTEILGHSGGGYGTIAFIGIDTKKRRGIVVLTNQSRLHPNRIGWTLLQGMPLTTESLTFPVREIVGIGIALEMVEAEQLPRITKVFSESPAGRAGLAAGLFIQKIDGAAMKGKSLEDCVGRLGGAIDTTVRLELSDPTKNTTSTVELTRQKFLTVNPPAPR